MLRVPHCLCQAMAWAFPMKNLYVSKIEFSRSSSSIIFSCVRSFSFCAGTLFIGFPMAFCFSKSLVFSSPKLKSSSPQISLKSSFCALGTVLRIFFVNDVTFEPVVRTLVPRRHYPLVSIGWIPPPLPCAMDNG